MFRSLRVRNFRLYASANLLSNTGTWMQRIGQDWLVLQLSDDNGVALGLITALQFGPSLLLSMYGGVLADRYDKRRMLLVTQSLMGLLALALGILVATDVVALEGMGLVTRTAHPTDGRQVVISLTPAAEELLAAEAQAREAWLSSRLQDLSAEDRATLRDAAAIMDKLASE